MQATIEKVGEFSIVTLNADAIDSSNVKEFKQQFQPVVDQGGKVIFDMGSIDFVDSSGLGSILSVMRQLTAKGGDLRICSMRKPVRALFELVRFHRILDVYNTRDEAING